SGGGEFLLRLERGLDSVLRRVELAAIAPVALVHEFTQAVEFGCDLAQVGLVRAICRQSRTAGNASRNSSPPGSSSRRPTTMRTTTRIRPTMASRRPMPNA